MAAATPITVFFGIKRETRANKALLRPTITEGEDFLASSALKVASITAEIGAKPVDGFAPATSKNSVAVAPGLTARTRTLLLLVSPQTA